MLNQKFELEDSLGYLLGRAARSLAVNLNKNFEKAGFDLNLDHWIVLVKLIREEGYNQQELCCITGRDKTSMTRLIDGMEKRNMVVRIPDKSDRRNKLVYLTNHGREVYERLLAIVISTNSENQENMNRGELETCKKVLKQVYQNASRK